MVAFACDIEEHSNGNIYCSGLQLSPCFLQDRFSSTGGETVPKLKLLIVWLPVRPVYYVLTVNCLFLSYVVFLFVCFPRRAPRSPPSRAGVRFFQTCACARVGVVSGGATNTAAGGNRER